MLYLIDKFNNSNDNNNGNKTDNNNNNGNKTIYGNKIFKDFSGDLLALQK